MPSKNKYIGGVLGAGLFVPYDEHADDVILLLDGSETSLGTDASPASNHPTNNGVTSVLNTSLHSVNRDVFNFNSATDVLTVADDTTLDFGTGAFTIEMWVKFDFWTTWMSLIGRKYGDASGWRLYAVDPGSNPPDQLRFYHHNGTTNLSVTAVDAPNLVVGDWIHIAVTRDSSSNLDIWINGVSKGSGTVTTDLSPTGYDLEIGKGIFRNSFPFDGRMADLRITKGVARDIAGNWAAGVYDLPSYTETKLRTTGMLSLAEHYQSKL